MNCPKCGSEMWDNKPKKATGEFKSNSPDYKCKNKDCSHVIWPPKKGEIPVAEIPPVVSESPAIEQKTKELTEIAKVIKSSDMLKCNAANVVKELIIADKVELKDFEAIYTRVLRILEK